MLIRQLRALVSFALIACALARNAVKEEVLFVRERRARPVRPGLANKLYIFARELHLSALDILSHAGLFAPIRYLGGWFGFVDTGHIISKYDECLL